MRVFFVHEDIYQAGNPYIFTLAECIKAVHPEDFEFGYGRKAFWSEHVFSYDIVHFHWPQSFIGGDQRYSADDLQKRILEFHKRGIKVVATCHDLKPHYGQCVNGADAMVVVYKTADVILHLGDYSKQLFEKDYPQAKHYIIPHHIYDTVYTKFPTRNEACKALRIKPFKKYILCFGTFRADEERQIAAMVAKEFKKEGYMVLAPGYVDISVRSRLPRIFGRISRKLQFGLKLLRYKSKGLIIKGRSWNVVPDDMLPYYYAASDLCLIQRKIILNSGNAFMPMLYDKVVVYPDTGNLGGILKPLGYPAFDTFSDESILQAVKEGIQMAKEGIAEKKHDELIEKYSTAAVSQLLYNYYQEILKS